MTPRNCLVGDCPAPHKAKGYCSRHYQRYLKFGDPNVVLQGPDVKSGEPRVCGKCGTDISHMKSNAAYCSRACKTSASNARNRDLYRERERQRYADDPSFRERKRLGARRVYWSDADSHREYSRQWRAENPHRRRTQHDVRADRMELHPDFRPFGEREWIRLLNRFGHSCAYCGAKGVTLEKDHVVPLSRGGRHAIANILPACISCNRSKFNHFLSEWRYAQRG